MKKSLTFLISTFLFGTLLLNAQPLDKKMLKQMEKDAKESYFSTEEGLPENTLCYFNKKGNEIGTIYIDSLKNKRLGYSISEKDSVIILFDSLGVLSSANYKTPKQSTPKDTLKYQLAPISPNQLKDLDKIFGPVINEE
ncbi:hypothetical protein J4465_01330 [Candidatus Pacearchaeota archaeon]|nr:hypothetical protein [Candidatus Pacearchaeota archaeon]